jgi:hypothetical protein
MPQKNIIGRLVFGIRFDSDTDAFSREESLESFACKRLMPVVDEVLGLHSANGALIRIGSLEIDLGNLSHEDFREKMPERLKERLDAAIREKIRFLKSSPSRQEGVFTRQEANYRLIEHFLSTGTLPWATDLKTDLPFSRLLQDVLASDGRRLAEFLKQSVPNARKRLARQFPAQDLISLVHLLAPDHYRFVIDTVEAIDQLQRKAAFIPGGREAAAQLTWDLVFEYLLDKDGKQFSPADFFALVIGGLALAAGSDATHLLRDLSTASPEVDVASESRSDHRNLLKVLAGNEAFDRLKTALVDMLEFGATSGFQAAWERLVMYYPDPTRAVVTMHGKKSMVRKRIAKFFSEAQIRQVIRLIEPENSAFIEAFADQSELIADHERVRPPDRSVHKKQVWEFVLTYLLVDRGSRFNEKAFAGSVIRQLAAHYNWSYRQLLTSLREAIEMTEPPGPMKERILGIVTELEGELATETQMRVLAGNEAFDRLKIALVDMLEFGATSGFQAAWEHLVMYYPDPTRAVVTMHGKKSMVRKRIAKFFSEAQIRQVIQLIEPENSVFIEAFADQSELIADDERVRPPDRSVHKKQVWEFVLTYLLVDRGSRFNEKAFAGSVIRQLAAHYNWSYRQLLTSLREAIEMTEPPGPMKERILGIVTELEGELATETQMRIEPATGAVADPTLTASYLTWFLTVAPVDPQEKALYRSLLEGLIADSPQAVGRYLIGMIKEPSLCAVFVRLTPRRLIRKALAAMAGFADGMRYVAILEGVFRPGTPAARCSPADFLRIVIDVLSEQRHADGEGFLKTAFGRLVARTGDTAARERAVDALEKIVSAKGAGLRSIAAHYRDATNLVPTGDKASAETRAPEEAAVLAYLKEDHPATPSSLPALKSTLEAMILHNPEKLYWFIAGHLDRSSIAEKLVALLSEPFQARLLHLLLPRHFARAQRYVDLLRNAAYGPGWFDSPDEVNQRIWQGAFTYLRETGLRVFDEGALVRRMVEFLAEKKKDTDRAAFYADLGQQLAADIQPSTRADHQALIRIVSEAAQQLRPSESVTQSPETQPAGTASVLNDDDEEEETPWEEEIYLANAGMVIAAPYLPRLFELLGLTEQSRFTSRDAAERGVHLLQYMVDERTSTPEYQLVLNKLLCGVKPGIPIVRGIEIMDKETETITGMIMAMIRNWKIIGNTSIVGFRESFLQREGRLMRKNDAWHLQVEERAFDMLLDQIPWSFSTIKYSWMDRVIFVKWT